jgi:hypothetical protein
MKRIASRCGAMIFGRIISAGSGARNLAVPSRRVYATATPEVRRDILTHLALREPGVRGGIRAAQLEVAHFAGRG